MNRSHLLAGLATAPLLAGASTRYVSAQDLALVRVGILGIATDCPVWIAQEKNYFRDQGVRIETVNFGSSEVMMPLLGAGNDLDIGSGAPAASLYNSVIRGLDIRAVADASTDPPGYGWSKLLIRTELVKNGKFKTIKDLKGMTVAGAARASSSAAQMNRLVQKAGIKYSDVQRTVLPYPQHVIALQNGAIDASLTIEPFATLAVESGAATAIIGNDQFYPNQEVSCVLCSSALIKNKRDVIVRYLRGFLRGVRYYQSALQKGKFVGPAGDDVVRIMAARTGQAEGLIRRSVPVAMDPNGRLNVSSMREDLAFYKAQNFIEGNVTVEQVIDTSLATEATKTIGLERKPF